jgi:hypothetical protein
VKERMAPTTHVLDFSRWGSGDGPPATRVQWRRGGQNGQTVARGRTGAVVGGWRGGTSPQTRNGAAA